MCSDLMRADARLADVCFVDRQRGWAVGDRGTIWHTNDGGRHWQLQPSGVSCPLYSVFFVDPQTGWAAGGFCHPYTHTSTGVVLATRDGGQHWQYNSKLLLPLLKQVRFFDDRHGWAVGCASAMFPAGVFFSDSGGRNWQPLPGASARGWLAGAFLGPNTGALSGRTGALSVLRQGGIEPARTAPFGLRSLTRLELVAPLYGWLIGDGGLVMMTGDLGSTWQTPPGEPLPELAQHFDFAALAVLGPKCWIAGSPGTRVFHSPDAGRTWTATPTAQYLPIHGLCFVDDRHGWAVGAMGTILATADGGQTWERQHSGGTHAALLGLFSRPEEIPLEMFARLSANDGYLGVVEVLNRRDVEVQPRRAVDVADRVHEAVVAVGGSGARLAWQFPLRQAGLGLTEEQIVDAWDAANDGRGWQQLQTHLVKQIRLWRPEVIVTEDAASGAEGPLAGLINRAVLQAVQKAADPTWLAEQISLAGLEPWQVKKVYAVLPQQTRGSPELTSAQLATRLGRSLEDLSAGPRGLLEDQLTAARQTIGFRLLASHLPQQPSREDFFSGINLSPGGEARRQLLEPPAENLESLNRIAQKRRNTQAIFEKSQQEPQSGAQLLAQTGELTRDLDPEGAAWILYHLAQQYHHTGQWDLAAETFQLLADRYPEHPLSRPAALWLVQYYASGEAAWRLQGKQRFTVQQASALSIDTSRQEKRPERAAAIASHLEQTQPSLFAEPALQFPLAVAHRNQGLARQAERFYMAASRTAARDAWWACAAGEQWLADPKGVPPKPVVACAVATVKPRLDGRLDDAVWQQARAAPLQSAQRDDAQWPACVMLAYDHDFLYLAISCRQAPGATYEAAAGPRPRDPDLSAHDRVDVLLDIDRDYVTCYQFTIDYRGWTGESCWGDRTWDPAWFVAARTAEGTWTAEAAIPLDQLTGRYPASRDVWAIGIQRTVPGIGFQSWSTPASTSVVPEGFGYLIFD